MSLQSWLQNSWLVQHTSSADEIKNLLAISDRDLAACQVKQLPADLRCAIAYNSALQAATAALAAAGFYARPCSGLGERWNRVQTGCGHAQTDAAVVAMTHL